MLAYETFRSSANCEQNACGAAYGSLVVGDDAQNRQRGPGRKWNSTILLFVIIIRVLFLILHHHLVVCYYHSRLVLDLASWR
jgi:hypothetical protein